jgi:uncharacterized protein YneF (UPF0154 family)
MNQDTEIITYAILAFFAFGVFLARKIKPNKNESKQSFDEE